MKQLWQEIPDSPKDIIEFYNDVYKYDKNPNKVNLTIGAYKDENGDSWELPCVREATRQLIASKEYSHDYLHIGGDKDF